MDELKKLSIIHVDTGREMRGGQGQVLALCKGLKKRGVRQLLLSPPGSPLSQRAEEAGVAHQPFNSRGEFDFLAARKLGKIIDERGAGIVHTHDAHAHALAWMATRRRPRAQLIVSRRVDFAISNNPFSRRKYLDPAVQYFAISTGVRDVLVEGGVASNLIRIVPSGVDPNRFDTEISGENLRNEFAIEPEAPLVGTIGSLVDHKDHRVLIDATPLVLERHPTARFFIVGDGELRSVLEQQISDKQLANHIILPGYRKDIETFLSGFDVFALSSHLEGLCTSVIDAMLFRLPVAATRTGGVPDLVRDGETGLLVEPKNPKALAEAIIKLIEDPALAQTLGEAAHAHAHAQFTAESLVKNTIAGYLAVSGKASVL